MSSTAEHQRFDFRDCVVEVAEGLVVDYLDKMHDVHLRPAAEPDCWDVYENNQPSGQVWRGIIAFDGESLLIQQARNLLIRVYRVNGNVETQLRITRIIESANTRKIVFPHDDTIEENLETGVRTIHWGDRTRVRQPDGSSITYGVDGKILDNPNTQVAGGVVSGDIISAFMRSLSEWKSFEQNSKGEFFFGGPPGLIEAAPGEPFSRDVEGKPQDIREHVSHHFEDGTILHEYLGRLHGVPFMGHELVTAKGLVLARMVEYDQPKKIMFADPRGLLREFPEVIVVEMQYDPQRSDYVTCITSANGDEYIHPKGASFEREEV